MVDKDSKGMVALLLFLLCIYMSDKILVIGGHHWFHKPIFDWITTHLWHASISLQVFTIILVAVTCSTVSRTFHSKVRVAACYGGGQRTAHATNGANRDAAAGDATISPRSVSAVLGGCCRQKVMLEAKNVWCLLIKAVGFFLPMVIVVLGYW